MVSKTVQREKERQDKWLKIRGCVAHEREHKQFLINLKKYMQSVLRVFKEQNKYISFDGGITERAIKVIKEDIKELTKMIETYALRDNGD